MNCAHACKFQTMDTIIYEIVNAGFYITRVYCKEYGSKFHQCEESPALQMGV